MFNATLCVKILHQISAKAIEIQERTGVPEIEPLQTIFRNIKGNKTYNIETRVKIESDLTLKLIVRQCKLFTCYIRLKILAACMSRAQ